MKKPLTRIRHPHYLKQSYASWRLRVLKHEHSGKRVHRQHTSYPLLGLMLLGTGAVLAQSTLSTYAATSGSGDVVISAKVLGIPPSQPADITAPTTGSAFTAQTITVSGTCPLKTYVQLFRNNYPSGTALCASDGTYSMQADLFSGANTLVAKIYNYADQEGPDSTTISVTYTPPVVIPPIQPTGGSTSGSTPTGSSSAPAVSGSSNPAPAATPSTPLLLRNDYHFIGYKVGEPASWQVAVLGGTAPYAINVAWGDGTTALYTSKTADTLTLTHTYTTPGPTDGSYHVIVTASDASGNHASLQILGLVTAQGGLGSSSGGSAAAPITTVFGIEIWQFIGSIWIMFGSLCIILLSFWLGEIREIRLIRTRYRMTKL